MWKYDTPIEEFELGVIKKAFPKTDIFNPNHNIDESGTGKDIMNKCFKIIRSCDALIFSDISGMVGKGVLDEIRLAQTLKIPVYRIVGAHVESVKSNIAYRYADKENYKAYAEILWKVL